MFKEILVPLDLGDEKIWRRALEAAVEMARLWKGRLHLMTVLPEFGLPTVAQYFPSDYEERARSAALERLQEIVRRHVPDEVSTGLIVTQGSIWREIVREARERDADLVVMGSHRPGIGDYVLGANATRVAQRAPCSVMIVRD